MISCSPKMLSTVKLPGIFENRNVFYQCSCGLLKSLTRTYFCRHCLKLRCADCVSHEVDSQYCQHCLEYIPTIDAKLKKNKCSTCFMCPTCEHTLTTRTYVSDLINNQSQVFQVPSENDQNQMIPKKASNLFCSFCKWSSKDVGIPDQPVGSGEWPEIKSPNAERLDALFESYKFIAQKEKLEKEKKRINAKTGAIHLLDKYGISASLSPKVTESLRAKLYGGRSSSSGLMTDSKIASDSSVEPSIATDEFEPLSYEDHYQQELDLLQVSSISQRLMQVEIQPTKVCDFHPMSKMLSVKRSLRCKECDHNLSKPEYNPSSIKFKIQLASYYHVPELRIKNIPQLKSMIPVTVELVLINPTPFTLHLNLLPDELNDQTLSGSIILPSKEISLHPKDDTVEVDLDLLEAPVVDDPKVISFRKGNKVGFYVTVTPKTDNQCKIAFIMKHDFLNTIIQLQGSNEREPQISWVSHRVLLNLRSE